MSEEIRWTGRDIVMLPKPKNIFEAARYAKYKMEALRNDYEDLEKLFKKYKERVNKNEQMDSNK